MIVNLFGMHDRRLCSVFNRSCAGDSVVLPQGSAAFDAIVACYPFCPEEAPALASDVQIFIPTPTIGPGIALLRLCGKTRRGRAVSAFHGSIRVQGTLSMQISRTGCILVMPSNAKRPSFVDVFTPQLSSQCYRITLGFMQFASKWLATVGPKTYQVRASTGASSQTLAKISGRNGSLFQLAPSSMKSQR